MSGSWVGSPSWITGREVWSELWSDLGAGLTRPSLHARVARGIRHRAGGQPLGRWSDPAWHWLALAGQLRWTTAHAGAAEPREMHSTESPASRLGFTAGTVVQELGWDNDTDDALRVSVEDAIDAEMVDGDYGNVVDAVMLWWRDDDGDLVDGLVDALTDLVGGGSIWLLTPKVGRPGAVDPADIAEAAPIAGLAQTTTAAVSKDWSATRMVAPKSRQ